MEICVDLQRIISNNGVADLICDRMHPRKVEAELNGSKKKEKWKQSLWNLKHNIL
jgi:hypothetical protein